MYDYALNIHEIDIIDDVLIYPVPGKEYIQVITKNKSDSDIIIEIYDTNGKLVVKKMYKNVDYNHFIDVSYLSNGLYIVKTYFDNQQHVRKFIKIQ